MHNIRENVARSLLENVGRQPPSIEYDATINPG